MPNLLWVLDPDPAVEHCDSCLAAAGQVHPAEAWAAAGLAPAAAALYCGSNCKCAFQTTTDPERGDLDAIPRRATEQRATLSAQAQPTAAGGFEILAITAGLGNGLTFPAAVLRASLSLWERVEVFVDHGPLSAGRSVRDLAGVAHSPTWSDVHAGIMLQLRPSGPSADLVTALGREMLSAAEPKPTVGFSADLLLAVDPATKTVRQVLRVLSLDLVFDPARGGAFLRALNQAAIRRETNMPNEAQTAGAQTAAGQTVEAQLAATQQAVNTLLGAQAQADEQRRQIDQANAVHVQLCEHLLATGLAASRLPEAAQAPIRARFAGKRFEPAELQTAIDEQRQLVAALTAASVIQGPGQVRAMFNTEDQLQAAVDDLMLVKRDDDKAALRVHRLSGVRELYHLMTGDLDFHGGYHPSRMTLQHTTASFAGLVKNAMNKAVAERWAQLGRAGYDWWEKIATVEHFDTLNSITWIITGSIGALPSIAEGAEYTELKAGDSPETSSFTKYGGYLGITLETMDRDDTRKLRALPRELASAALRRISALVAAIFTDNSAVGPTLADTGALFNNTAVTTAGGHKNLLTTALSATEWEVVSTAVYNQPLLVANETGFIGTGAKQAVNPRYALVPRALQLTAMKILYPTLENAANIYSENLQRGQPGDVLVVPEWTDATDWAAVVDPAIAPAVMVGERFGVRPEIFVAGDELSPAMFMNDEARLKVRQYVAVGVADYRPLHKSNVAG